MDDLISRQAAIDVLHVCLPGIPLKRLNEILSAVPSAQPSYTDEQIQKMQELEQAEIEKAFQLGREDALSEIIRCKDCKHQVKEWRDDKRFKDKGYWVYGCKVISDICGYWAWFGQDDEFCSEAERRTDETD